MDAQNIPSQEESALVTVNGYGANNNVCSSSSEGVAQIKVTKEECTKGTGQG